MIGIFLSSKIVKRPVRRIFFQPYLEICQLYVKLAEASCFSSLTSYVRTAIITTQDDIKKKERKSGRVID